MKEIIESLSKLESLRNGVPTYALFDGIHGLVTISLTKQLKDQELTNTEEVDVILHSPGGDPSHAYRLIRTFRERFKIVNVIVPLWAKSAATLFAFGGSRLVLHEYGELGPIDAQIKKDDESPEGAWASALNVESSLQQLEERSRRGMLEMFTKLRSIPGGEEFVKIGRKPLAEMLLEYSAKFYHPLMQKIETVEIGIMARYLEIGNMYAKRILKQYTDTPDDKINELLYFLVYECPDHGYVVDYPVLKSYLPHVIKANETPFTPEYYTELENLSIILMMGQEPTFSGFIKNLKPKGNIKENNHDGFNPQPIESKAAGSDGPPRGEGADDSRSGSRSSENQNRSDIQE